VAWERRGGKLYYYQSEREDGRVRKRYIGAGEVAKMIAHRAERRERARTELEEAKGLALADAELHQAAEILARAQMVAAGYHRRKGEWRRRRSA
jgi:hypothetical protein